MGAEARFNRHANTCLGCKLLFLANKATGMAFIIYKETGDMTAPNSVTSCIAETTTPTNHREIQSSFAPHACAQCQLQSLNTKHHTHPHELLFLAVIRVWVQEVVKQPVMHVGEGLFLFRARGGSGECALHAPEPNRYPHEKLGT
eukprot:1160802-Pelagomonas_calceolata.AAC.7